MISFCLAFARPCYYTTFFPVCQYLFQNFFEVFFGLSAAPSVLYPPPALAVSLHIILHPHPFCQELFSLFSPFFTFSALQTVFVRHFVRLFGRLVCIFNKEFGGLDDFGFEISLLCTIFFLAAFFSAVHNLFLCLWYTITAIHRQLICAVYI